MKDSSRLWILWWIEFKLEEYRAVKSVQMSCMQWTRTRLMRTWFWLSVCLLVSMGWCLDIMLNDESIEVIWLKVLVPGTDLNVKMRPAIDDYGKYFKNLKLQISVQAEHLFGIWKILVVLISASTKRITKFNKSLGKQALNRDFSLSYFSLLR